MYLIWIRQIINEEEKYNRIKIFTKMSYLQNSNILRDAKQDGFDPTRTTVPEHVRERMM